jgi:multiple sugar transport system ATP-binding protein
MRAEIKKLQARLQVTTIYVTHDQVEAMTMGHRIAVLQAGKLQQVGAPLDLYEHPANLFVAAFIGTPPMNFFQATVGEGGRRLTGAGFTLPAPGRLQAALAGRDGARLVVGVRPENAVPPGRASRGETAPLAVTVEIVEPLGNEVVVHARLGGETLVFKQDPHRPTAIGATLDVAVELDAVHLFDAQTELRIGD